MLANGYVMESYVRPLSIYCSKIGLARSVRIDAVMFFAPTAFDMNLVTTPIQPQ